MKREIYIIFESSADAVDFAEAYFFRNFESKFLNFQSHQIEIL